MPKPIQTQTTMAERSYPTHPSSPPHHHYDTPSHNTSRHRDPDLLPPQPQLPLNPNDYWLEHYDRLSPPPRPKPKRLPSLAPYTSKWKSKYPNPKTRDGLLAKLSKLFENDSKQQNYYGGYPMGGMGMGYGGMGMGGMGMGGMGMGGMYPGRRGMGGMGGYGVSQSWRVARKLT
jgi:hypothetical protein